MNMVDFLVVAPIALPLLTAALTMMAWQSHAAQRWLGVMGALALLAATVALFLRVREDGILVTQLGNWEAPYGIILVADQLSAVMLMLSAVLVLGCAIYSLAAIDKGRERFGYYPLLHVMVMGVCGSFLTGDVFNLYVWFEVMLIASFALLALGGEREQLDGALKYVIINIVSSSVLLLATGMLYGLTGTLNMADIAIRLAELGPDVRVSAVAMLFLVAFGLKAALFPLFFWLPASYHTPHIAVSAIFSGLLTKVGAYVMVRYFTLIFVGDIGLTHTLILWLSVATMFLGVLGAVSQFEWRKILSIHIISQIGYMTLALAVYTPLALAGAVMYIGHNIIIKANLFLVAGLGYRIMGTYDLGRLGGLYKHFPWLAVLFLLSAFSLAGVPPLWGFWAKFVVIRSTLEAHHWVAAGFALFTGVLTLFSMTKIWMYAFWKKLPEGTPDRVLRTRLPWQMVLPCVVLLGIAILFGVLAGPVLDVALAVGNQVCNPEEYIRAVLPAHYLEALEATTMPRTCHGVGP